MMFVPCVSANKVNARKIESIRCVSDVLFLEKQPTVQIRPMAATKLRMTLRVKTLSIANSCVPRLAIDARWLRAEVSPLKSNLTARGIVIECLVRGGLKVAQHEKALAEA